MITGKIDLDNSCEHTSINGKFSLFILLNITIFGNELYKSTWKFA